MKRKVAEWVDYTPPRQWTAKLECGHSSPDQWDETNYTDEGKSAIEAEGDLLECVDCTKLEERVLTLEKKAKELRLKLDEKKGKRARRKQ